MGTNQKHLSEVLLMNTTTCFHGEVRKYQYSFLLFLFEKVPYPELRAQLFKALLA